MANNCLHGCAAHWRASLQPLEVFLPTLSVVIPCRNEAGAIPGVLGSLAKVRERMLREGLVDSCEVLVVDDASSDETPILLRQHSWIKVISLSRQLGYGAALKEGFDKSHGEWIAFLDLDGTYDPEDLLRLVEKFSENDESFLLGERFSLGLGMPVVRAAGNIFFTSLVRTLFRQSVSDVCTGFRIFNRRWLPEIKSLPNAGLDFSLAMTLWAIRSGVEIREVPIRYHLRTGSSKLSVVSDGNRFLWTILRNRYRPASAIPVPADLR